MQNLTIVFKFRDEILLSKPQENHLIVPEGYDDESKKWHETIFDFQSHTVFEVIPILPNFNFGRRDLEGVGLLPSMLSKLKEQIQNFLLLLEGITLDKRYLFEHVSISSFNDFTNLIPLANPKNTPNFYNYFDIRFDKNIIEENQFIQLIDQFEQFLPHTNDYKHHLLDFVYLKNDVIETSITETALNGSGMNQAYFNDMQMTIVDTDNAAKGQGVKVSIVEVNHWNLGHAEFGGLSPTLIFPLSPASANDILRNPNLDNSFHGNGVLGILAAKKLTPSDQCYGIVPKATFQLSTCQSTIDLLVEENAIWEAINKSSKGDIVLVEFSNSDHSPIEYQPVIYQLLRFASQNGIIIIEPAGNGGSDIKNEAIWGNLKLITTLSGTIRTKTWDNYTTYMSTHQELQTTSVLDKTTFINYLLNNETGAILVGATNKNNLGSFEKSTFSNFSTNVEIYAQGNKIATPSSNKYQVFGFTSGAAAIITGVVASLQGIRKAAPTPKNKPLNAQQMKSVLTGSSPTLVGINGHIPNYKNAKMNVLALP